MNLSPNISFCQIGNHYIFLDLARDRYFSIGQHTAHLFQSVLDGDTDTDTITALERFGLLSEANDQPITPCKSDIPKTSVLDQTHTTAPMTKVIALAWNFALVRARLKRHGIAGPALQLASTREAANSPHSPNSLEIWANASTRLMLLRGGRDLCLPHSLALAMQLTREGFDAEVVLGVKFRPFCAHSWVECNGKLVNDRFDHLRSYTPIRRL